VNDDLGLSTVTMTASEFLDNACSGVSVKDQSEPTIVMGIALTGSTPIM
jgi:hypothetical protein